MQHAENFSTALARAHAFAEEDKAFEEKNFRELHENEHSEFGGLLKQHEAAQRQLQSRSERAVLEQVFVGAFRNRAFKNCAQLITSPPTDIPSEGGLPEEQVELLQEATSPSSPLLQEATPPSSPDAPLRRPTFKRKGDVQLDLMGMEQQVKNGNWRLYSEQLGAMQGLLQDLRADFPRRLHDAESQTSSVLVNKLVHMYAALRVCLLMWRPPQVCHMYAAPLRDVLKRTEYDWLHIAAIATAGCDFFRELHSPSLENAPDQETSRKTHGLAMALPNLDSVA
ncbi:hypothetical protein CYMTET_35553, partial [Cymbomonas tetramitiformis]